MDLYSITVYRNLEELRKIQDEREVNPFIFGNTKDNIDYCPEICIDISALIHLLLINKSNIESAYMNLARCDREMAETDTSGSSEEKREKQVKFPAFHAAQTEVNLEEKSKVEQQTVNQTEQKPEKKNSIRKQLAEKKKECEERDAKQQTVRKKRNYDMSL